MQAIHVRCKFTGIHELFTCSLILRELYITRHSTGCVCLITWKERDLDPWFIHDITVALLEEVWQRNLMTFYCLSPPPWPPFLSHLNIKELIENYQFERKIDGRVLIVWKRNKQVRIVYENGHKHNLVLPKRATGLSLGFTSVQLLMMHYCTRSAFAQWKRKKSEKFPQMIGSKFQQV